MRVVKVGNVACGCGLMENQGISLNVRIHTTGTMNVCSKCKDHLFIEILGLYGYVWT